MAGKRRTDCHVASLLAMTAKRDLLWAESFRMDRHILPGDELPLLHRMVGETKTYGIDRYDLPGY